MLFELEVLWMALRYWAKWGQMVNLCL